MGFTAVNPLIGLAEGANVVFDLPDPPEGETALSSAGVFAHGASPQAHGGHPAVLGSDLRASARRFRVRHALVIAFPMTGTQPLSLAAGEGCPAGLVLIQAPRGIPLRTSLSRLVGV